MTLRHLVVGVMFYLVGLAAMAPATLLTVLAAWASDDRVRLTDSEGSLWSGRAASLTVAIPNGPPLRLEAVRWHIAPQRWFLGEAPVHVANEAGDVVVAAGLAPVSGGVELIDFRVSAKLETLSPYLGGELVDGLAGSFQFGGARLGLGDVRTGRLEGVVRVTAGRLPAGAYDLTVIGEGRRFALRWLGPQGPKAMSGGGWWDDRLRLDGLPGAVTR